MSKELEVLKGITRNKIEYIKKQPEIDYVYLKYYEGVLDLIFRLEAIENSNPSEALKCLERVDNTLCLNNIKGTLEFGIDSEEHIDCDSVIGMTEDLETIEQALIQANHYLGARRNGKTLEQMYQLVQHSRTPMKPSVWIARIDGKLEQRVIMEKEDYDKLEDKVQAQEGVLDIILTKPYECAATLNYIQINKDNPKMLDYEHYSMAVKYLLPEEDFERLVRYVTNG